MNASQHRYILTVDTPVNVNLIFADSSQRGKYRPILIHSISVHPWFQWFSKWGPENSQGGPQVRDDGPLHVCNSESVQLEPFHLYVLRISGRGSRSLMHTKLGREGGPWNENVWEPLVYLTVALSRCYDVTSLRSTCTWTGELGQCIIIVVFLYIENPCSFLLFIYIYICKHIEPNCGCTVCTIASRSFYSYL